MRIPVDGNEFVFGNCNLLSDQSIYKAQTKIKADSVPTGIRNTPGDAFWPGFGFYPRIQPMNANKLRKIGKGGP